MLCIKIDSFIACDAEIVFNWFDDIDFSYVITSFLAMFLSWCFDQDNFLIKVLCKHKMHNLLCGHFLFLNY